MATTESLRAKILTYIGETEAHDDGAYIRYDIDTFLNAALGKLAFIAPLHLLRAVDFSTQTITANPDGSGTIALPEDFVRLVEFKLGGWYRSVTIPIHKESAEYGRQMNPITRGSIERPVVVLSTGSDCKQFLTYYGTPKGDALAIDIAEYVSVLKVETLTDKLIEALCWLTASDILAVANETQAAQYARQQFEQEILLSYGNTTGNDK